MPKATKKSTSPKSGTVKKVTVEEVSPSIASTPVVMNKPLNSKVISFALIVVVIGLITYKVGPWLVPSVVENKAITRFSIWSRLEKSYGAQALEDMVNEKILDNAIAKAQIKVDQSKIDSQVADYEKQYENTEGGLDEALKQIGLSRKDLIKQVVTQFAVEEILSDKINPTDEEIKAQFDLDATTKYKDKKLDEVKPVIIKGIREAKLREAFLVWFADIKKEAKVKSFGL